MERDDKSVSSRKLLCDLRLMEYGRAVDVSRCGILLDVVPGLPIEESLAHVPGNIGVVAIVAQALATMLELLRRCEAAERTRRGTCVGHCGRLSRRTLRMGTPMGAGWDAEAAERSEGMVAARRSNDRA